MRWLGLLALIITILIASCVTDALDETVEIEPPIPLLQTMNRNGQYMKLVVHVHEDETELNLVFKDIIRNNPDRFGVDIDDIEDWWLLGFSFFVDNPKDKKNQKLWCDIHVVKPSHQKDFERINTWGHELMHCVYGGWHKD